MRLNREARTRFLRFATSAEAVWAGNFRDLNAAVTRMTALSDSGRIGTDVVDEELDRLRDAWRVQVRDEVDEVLGELAAEIDPFDRVQLAEVIRTCRRSATLSEAGRELFAVSRTRKKSSNDADRLRKYLARYGLTFADVDGDPSVVGQTERPILDDFVAMEDGPRDRAASEAESVLHVVGC